MDTSTRFLRSSIASTFSQASRVLVLLAANLVLRRLVRTEDWGLWQWAETVFLVSSALRDLGLPSHVMRLSPRPYKSLLRLEAVWGGALSLLIIGGAGVLEAAYADRHPGEVAVLRLLAVSVFLEGLAVTPLNYMEGELKIGRAVFPELVRAFLFASLAVTLALRGCGVWSMVVAHVAAAAVYAALLWLRVRGRIPLGPVQEPITGLLRKSWPLGSMWLVSILVFQVDLLILGARFTGRVVGEYGFALFLAYFLSRLLVPALGRTLYPALVALSGKPDRQVELFRLVSILHVALEVPAALFLFINAESVVWVGGAQWIGSAVYLKVLCLAPLVTPFGRFSGDLLLARHADRVSIASAYVTLASYVTFGVLLTSALGPVGMAWADLLPLGEAVLIWGLAQVSPGLLRRMVKDFAFVYAVPIPLFLGAALVSAPGSSQRLALGVAAGAAAFALQAWRLRRDLTSAFAADQ